MASDTSEKEIIDSSLIQDRKERCQESSNEGSTEEIQLVQHEQSARTSNSEAVEAIPKTQIDPEHHSKFNSNASEAPDVTPLSGKEPANIGVYVDITNNFGIVIVCVNSQLIFEPGNTIDELITKIQNSECINEEPKPITFNRKQLDSHQSNKKYSRINRSEFCQTNRSEFCRTNRSEFCLGQTTEDEATFKVHTATEHQPIHINNNSSIVIITFCSKYNSNTSVASDVSSLSEEVSGTLNINITNNFGNVIVCDNGQINIDVQPNDTIEIITIQDKKGVSLDQQRLILDEKRFDGGQSNMENSLNNRSEFCQS